MQAQMKSWTNRILEIEKDVLDFISSGIKEVLKRIDFNVLKDIEEIRLRANKPLMVEGNHGDWFVCMDGELTTDSKNSYIVSQAAIIETLELMSENSIYAYLDEIKNGFITLKGGHRVGIAGRVVLDGKCVKNIKDISGLNIRISKEITGCSDCIIDYIVKSKNEVFNTLIISPPQCGKTTFLRDITRQLGDGIEKTDFKGIKTGVVDERSEIAACFKGVPQNKIGIRTDVLDGCPKEIGMSMMIRSMSPQVIVTDEIGNDGDKEAIMRVINAGVKIITSAHGYNISELKTRKEVVSLIEDKIFERYVVLSRADGPGTVEEVIEGTGMSHIYRRGTA